MLATVRLDVLAQRRRVRVGLVAAGVAAVVRLVARVHVRVLLAVGTVGEATLATDKLTAKRLLAYTPNGKQMQNHSLRAF